MDLKNLSGAGTDFNPYIITSGEELDCIRQDVTACYRLANTIDLTEICNASDGTGWQPIENFTGVLDGAGFSITNLFINRTENNQALFSTTNGCTIMNLGVTNASVAGGALNTAILVGNILSYDDLIENCFVSGTVRGQNYIAGIVGQMNGGTIKNCYSEAQLITTITSGGYAGGICAKATTSNPAIIKCFFNGTIAGATTPQPYYAHNAVNAVADKCHYNSTKLPISPVVAGNLDDDGMRDSKNFADWQDEYYNFDRKVWGQKLNDYPHLYFEVSTRYLIAVENASGTTYYTFVYEDSKGVWKALTSSEIAGAFPTASEFENYGLIDAELSAISRLDWNKLREITDEFELIASTDKYTIERTITQQEMTVEQELSDAIILATEIDFSAFGDSINQIKIVQ